MESIGLFCAASDRLEASYYDLAGAFGRLVGERGLTLVYGGADSGLMESAARGVKNPVDMWWALYRLSWKRAGA